MKRFKEIISAIFWSILRGLIGSFVASLIILMSITSLYQAPIITLFVALCFVPFHFNAFKNFYLHKDWFIMAGRFFCMILISSFLVGLFRAALESIEFKNVYLLYILIVSCISMFFILTPYFFLNSLYPNGSTMKSFDKFIEGAKKYGIFWDY